METFAEGAIAIIDELRTERLDYTSEYVPLINAAQTLEYYEETGLMPEEVRIMRDEVYRLREKLARYEQAEQEGRLVELPCKVGDSVWVIDKSGLREATVKWIDQGYSGIWHIHAETDRAMSRWFGFEIKLDDFGKTVFLTREEAALKERESNGL